jgi:hypothetical protein
MFSKARVYIHMLGTYIHLTCFVDLNPQVVQLQAGSSFSGATVHH